MPIPDFNAEAIPDDGRTEASVLDDLATYVGVYVDAQVAAAVTASLQKAANLGDLPDVPTARASLGLGTAATHAATDFDAAGSAAAAQAAAEAASDAAGTAAADVAAEAARAVAAEATALQKASNLSDLPNAATARASLGLGSAATHPATDFDAAGAAAAAQAAAEAASDAAGTAAADVAAEATRAEAAEAAALQKASNLSDLLNAATARASLGLGSAATHPATDFDAAGAAAAAQTAAIAAAEAASVLRDGTGMPSTVASKAAVGDAVLYLSTAGADANDGLSEGSAKLTLDAAIAALPAAGGRIKVKGGKFNFTPTTYFLSKANVVVAGEGEDVTTINIAQPGTYVTPPTGFPAVSAPGSTLTAPVTMPANGASVTIAVGDTTNLTTATVYVGGPADVYGNPAGSGYPYVELTVTSRTSNSITGTVVSGGGVACISGAHVVAKATNGIQMNAANIKFRDLTIDATDIIGGYPLIGNNFADIGGEHVRVIGGAAASSPAWQQAAYLQGPRNFWRNCRSPVFIRSAGAADCVVEGNQINITRGIPTPILVDTGAARCRIVDNTITNSVALNSNVFGITLQGTVTNTTANGAVNGGATSVVVASAAGFAVGQMLFIGCTDPTAVGTPGIWELRKITSVVGTTIGFTYPLHNPYPTGVEVASIQYLDGHLVEGNVITNTLGPGIRMGACSGGSIIGNKVRYPGGPRPDGGPAVDGIDLHGCVGCEVSGNEIAYPGGYGIDITGTSVWPGSAENLVQGNLVLAAGDPLITCDATIDSTIAGNTLLGGSHGVAIGEADYPSARIVVRGNRMVNCDWVGVSIGASSACAVVDNEFVNCAWNTGRNQGDSVIIIYDSYSPNMPGAHGNVVARNRYFRSMADLNPSSYINNFSSVGLSLAQLASYPPGGTIPKFMVRSTPISGSGKHTTLSGALSLPAGTIAVADTTGFPTSGTLYIISATPTQVAPITWWGGSIVTYTGISGNTFTGCAVQNGSANLPSGSMVADTIWPMLNTGYNIVVDNDCRFLGRRTGAGGAANSENALATTDSQDRNLLNYATDLIFDFETVAGSLTGSGSSGAENADHSQGSNSFQITTGTSTTTEAYFTTGLAAGWPGKLAALVSDDMIEIDIKLTDANLKSIRFGFTQDGGITNYADSGPFYTAAGSPSSARTTQVEPSAAGWVTYRMRKADFMLRGTATWANIIGVWVEVIPLTGTATVVRVDNLRVAYGGVPQVSLATAAIDGGASV